MTENINGIQVDISKYVGEEIARLAVASIDEDRLNRLAEQAIRDLYEDQCVDCKLEHDGSWVDGKWYEWEDVRGNREVARMKLDAIDHFYPHTKIIKEEDVCRYRELEEGEDNADH